MELDNLGITVSSRERYARIIALGNRASPAAFAPCLIIDQNSSERVTEDLAPFYYSQTRDEIPGSISISGRLPLSIPFDSIGPNWKTQLDFVLPPSLESTKIDNVSTSVKILPLSWHRMLHSLNPQVVILMDALQIAQSGDKLPSALIHIKHRFPSALIWCPGISGPDNLAVLTWMGVDLHDLGRTHLTMSADLILDTTGPRTPESSLNEEFTWDKQIEIWRIEFSRVRQAIIDGNIRELVEKRALNSPKLIQHVRNHDKLLSKNKVSTLVRNNSSEQRIRFNSSSSFNDPLVVDWVERLKNDYIPPTSRSKLLLLLPCSERKPYRLSHSHRKFRQAVGDLAIHEVMVTSPLGLVPRDLEYVWPARHYDIPVTGDWSADELNRINMLVEHFTQNFDYKAVINHCGLELYNLNIPVYNSRIGNSATSYDDLQELKRVIQELAHDFKISNLHSKDQLFDEFLSISRHTMLNDKWMKELTIGGKPPRWKLFNGKIQFAQWNPDRGTFSLSKNSLETLNQNNSLRKVWIKEDIDWKGDIFASNLKNCDVGIRLGEDILVMQENRLIGSARSVVSEWEWLSPVGRLARAHQRIK